MNLSIISWIIYDIGNTLFNDGVTGLYFPLWIITKLDGTAKGGVVIGITDQFKIPIKYIGVGEKIGDLQLFHKGEFVNSFFD